MKTKIIERSDRYICSLTGDAFSHDGSQAGKSAAIEKLTAHQTAAMSRLETKRSSARQHFFGQQVKHPETRTPDELRAAAQAKTPKQPSGRGEPVNPFAGAFERKVDRLGYNWGQSPAGREERAKLKKLSKEWEAKQQAAKQQADFEQSIAPVVAHAKASFEAVRNDPTATQLEVEQAEERLKLANSDVSAYSAADKEWRQRQSEKIIAQAVEVDSQLSQLRQQRDALLQAAYEPVAEPTEPAMVDVYYPPFFHDPAKAGKTIREPMPQGI